MGHEAITLKKSRIENVCNIKYRVVISLVTVMTDPTLKKKVSSPYKQETYYWRGGDVLREKEYLIDEFKKATEEYRLRESELKQVESELREAEETLREREEYTNALAGFLDSDAEGGQQESYFKKRLAFIECEISEAESELQETRAVHNPAVSSGLQKEKAYLIIDNQRLYKAIELAVEEYENSKRQTAACMASNKYDTVFELEGRLQELQRKKGFLRQLVSQKKKDFDSTRPIAPSQSSESRTERNILISGSDTELVVQRQEERRQRNPKKWDHRLNRLIEFIEELNDRLFDLGLDEDVVDTSSLRSSYLSKSSDEQDKDKDGEEKGHKKKIKKVKEGEKKSEEGEGAAETD
jgi:hypothetical protein